MKPINDYIVERIRIDNIKPWFPIDGTHDDMMEFLENQGFTRFMWQEHSGWTKFFNYQKQKCFSYKPDDQYGCARLIFTNSTNKNIGKENPIYRIHFDGDKRIFYIMYSGELILLSRKEFLGRLNKQFGF